MKKLAIVMLLAWGFAIIAVPLAAKEGSATCGPKVKAAYTPGKKEDKAKKKAVCIMWTCPMHADVLSAKPGKCPKCGMKLEKKIIKKGTEKIKTAPKGDIKAVWTCPMHPEVKSAKPGKCPKCGMNLEKAGK